MDAKCLAQTILSRNQREKTGKQPKTYKFFSVNIPKFPKYLKIFWNFAKYLKKNSGYLCLSFHFSHWFSTNIILRYSVNYFIYTSRHLTPHGRNELNKLTSLPMCGFIAQLVEHRTGIAEVTGSNPVEAQIFFQASSLQLLKLESLLRWSFFTLMLRYTLIALFIVLT